MDSIKHRVFEAAGFPLKRMVQIPKKPIIKIFLGKKHRDPDVGAADHTSS